MIPGLRQLTLWISLAVLAGLFVVGCQTRREEQTPESTPTAWPTLAPLISTQQDPVSGELILTGPQLIDKFRVEIVEGATAIYPLEGHLNQPVRIEVIVLEGNLNPFITLNNAAGDRLASANTGGLGEPEVIGQFQFPGDGFYELGIGVAAGSGQVGVSIYFLEPAELEGGVFSSLGQDFHGKLAQPASYHTFRVDIERGQRFDIAATALTPGLDLIFELYGPDGRLQAARDDNVDKDPHLWNFMPNQSGTYTIVLSNYEEQTGEYVLQVSASEGGGDAAIGTRTELELNASPRRSIWLTFEGRSFEALRIEGRPIASGVDIVMDLYDPYGNRIISANLNGANEPEILSFVQLPADGTYQLEFTTVAEGGQIEYVIRPTSRPEDDELGGRVGLSIFPHKGVMDGSGMLLVYAFDGDAGHLVGVAARTAYNTELDLGFDLYAPDGTLLTTHDDDVGKDPVVDRIELPLTGRYVVAVWNFEGSTGPFELVISNAEAPAALPGG